MSPDVKFTKETASYIIRLVNGSTKTVPADLMQPLITPSPPSSEDAVASPYHSWVSHNSPCTVEYNGNILKGKSFCLPNDTWEFHSTNGNGILKQRYPLLNFHKAFTSLIDLELIRLAWSSSSLVPLLITSPPRISPTHALAPSNKPWIAETLMSQPGTSHTLRNSKTSMTNMSNMLQS